MQTFDITWEEDAIQPTTCRSLSGRQGATIDNWWSTAALIAGVLLLTVFEGALRKWAFPANPLLRYGAYFSKDILFLYAAYLGMRRGKYFKLSWLVVCAAIIIVPSAAATLMSANPVGTLLSLRAYLLIPACAYLAAPLIRNFRDVERCAMVVAMSAVMVAMIGIYQYSLPATHILNRYDGSSQDPGMHIVATTGHVRATGTFAYISGMAMMAGVSAWAGVFLALPLPGRSLLVRMCGVGALIAGVLCSASAMSRGGLMFWGVTVVGGCFLYFRPTQIISFLLLVAVGYLLFVSDSDNRVELTAESDSLFGGLAHRIENGDSVSQRGGYMLMNLILGAKNHPLGEGIGVGQAGGAYAVGNVSTLGYESEWGRIAFEVGPLGLAAILFVRFATARRCWEYLASAREVETRLVLAASLPYFAIISLGWMAFNHTGNSFAWGVITLALSATCGYGRQPRS